MALQLLGRQMWSEEKSVVANCFWFWDGIWGRGVRGRVAVVGPVADTLLGACKWRNVM